jgi:cation transport regulator ChaB
MEKEKNKKEVNIALFDKDLDGILSAALYNEFFNFDIFLTTDEDINKNINKLNRDIVIKSFDIAFDKLKRTIKNLYKEIKKVEIYDHHYSKESDYLLNNVEKGESHISLFEDSTYTLIKNFFGMFPSNREKIRKFEEKYKNLINYMLKVENERFHQLQDHEKILYFEYFNKINEWLNNKDYKNSNYLKLVLKDIQNFLNSSLYKYKKEEIEKIEKLKKEEIINNVYEILENKDKSKVIFYFDSPEKNEFRYNIPYFYHNRDILIIVPQQEKNKEGYSNKYLIVYRLKNINFWLNLIFNYKGGGKVVDTGKTKKAVGVAYVNKQDLKDIIYKFIKLKN